jgi:archaellum component FlaC
MATSTSGGGGNASDEAGRANEKLEQLRETVEILKDSFESIGRILKNEINDNLSDASRQTRDWGKSVASGINKDLQSMAKSSQDILRTQMSIADGSIREKDVTKQKNDFLKRAAATEVSINNARKNGLISASTALKYTRELKAKLEEQLIIYQQQELYARKIEKSMGNLGKVFKGISQVPIVGQLVNAEKILDKMQKAAADGKGQLGVMGAGIKETFKTAGDSLTDLTTIFPLLIGGFMKLVKLAAEYQSKQFEAARDLGVSVERGKQLRDTFVDVARANASMGVTADQLQKSYEGVQNQLGFIVKQSQEFNLSTALIERRIGASAENMALLQFAAKKSGDTLMGTYKTISGITKEVGARVKLELSEKQVLEEVGKVSATVYQNFNGNYKALTAAVVQAKALGTTLDKINATQDQFLDFETSIAKQFEAEVLSGEQLDLSAARQYALNHDTLGLMKEINKFIGDNAKFNAMDAITQKSKAEALGLSRDAVAEMLREQEKAQILGAAAGADLQTQYEVLLKQGKTRKEIVDTLGQEAVTSAQQASVSEKLAATMDAIKNTIAQSAQILIPMVDKIVTWLSKMENLKKVFASIVGIMASMAAYSVVMKIAGAIQLQQQNAILGKMAATLAGETAIAEARIVGAGASATAGAGYLGPGALAVGAAVIAGLLGYLAVSSAMGSGGASSGIETGGGSGGGASAEMPSTGMSTTPAISTPTTTSNPTSYSASGTNVTSGNGKSVGDVYIDGSKIGQIIFKNANQQQLNMV